MRTPSLAELEARYVMADARYRLLLHGNFLQLPDDERAAFTGALVEAAREVSAAEVEILLRGGWREQLTGAFLAGFARHAAMRARIGELLVASRTGYVGQGCCFALASFGTAEDAAILAEYLDRWLPTRRQYDQAWAVGALVYLDGVLGGDLAAPYLAEGGAWQGWLDGLPGFDPDPAEHRDMITRLCAISDEVVDGILDDRPTDHRPTDHRPTDHRPADD